MKKTIAVLILCCTVLGAALFASVYILIAFPFDHSIQIASVIIISEAIILSTPLLIMIVACRNAFGVSTAAKSGCAILFFKMARHSLQWLLSDFQRKSAAKSKIWRRNI